MTAVADRPTSITSDSPVTPRFAQDQQTRTWVFSDRAPVDPSRADILKYAQRELAALRRLPRGWDGGKGVPLRPEFASLALLLVDLVTTDDGLATPQFSPLPDGGLSITWLVGGDRLAINLDPYGLDPYGISIRGVWAGGHESFRFEPDSASFLRSEFEAAIDDARTFLLKISTRVQHQLLTS
jgi:hypothetical protein